MATRRNGLNESVATGAKRAALLVLALAGAACARFPTAPETAELRKWEGDPVVTCIPACPAVRAPGGK